MSQPLIDAYLDELLAPGAGETQAGATSHLSVVPAVAEPACTPAPASTPMPAPALVQACEPVAERAPQPAAVAAPARMPVEPVTVLPPVAAARSTGARPGRWLRVGVEHDRYAVELLRVQEVVRVMPVVAMRGAAPAVLGVMNLRGRIVPVFDLGVWLGVDEITPDERARVVVVERDDELIGVLVSAVHDVVTLGDAHIEPPVDAGTPGAIVGVARTGDMPTVLLDANALFD